MKYELEPDNRNCADEVLLHDLVSVASKLDKPSVTKEEYDRLGRFSPATIQNRFRTWNAALERSGLAVQKRNAIPREELAADIARVGALVGAKILTTADYGRLGHFHHATVVRAFGSWNEALEVAGLSISSQWHRKTTDEELLSNMAAVWVATGRLPMQADFRPPLSKISEDSYVRRFGSWRKALEAFVALADSTAPSIVLASEMERGQRITTSGATTRPHTQRSPGWRLSFLVTRRDRFSCRACGRSPANDPGVVLHVDHVVPWSLGGETTLENLQTLCERCNIGKGDLAMRDEDSDG